MLHPFFQGPWPRAFAHRGWHIEDFADMENSLSAFRRAADEGYDYVETDARATADGVVILQHDADLDRTTDGRGSVRSLPWSSVGAARIAGRERVCRLDELLEELPRTMFNIDVKEDSAVEPVLRVLRRHRAFSRVCLAAFDERRVDRMRRHAGPGALTSMGSRSAQRLWVGSRYGGWPLRSWVSGAAAQVPPYRGRTRVVDERFVRLAHRWGVEVHAWTVNDPERMRALLDLGVDGLITDQPRVLRDVLAEWAGQRSGGQRSADPMSGPEPV